MYVFSNLDSAYHQLSGLIEFIREDITRTKAKLEKATKKVDIAILKGEIAAYESIIWAIENSSEYKRGNKS